MGKQIKSGSSYHQSAKVEGVFWECVKSGCLGWDFRVVCDFLQMFGAFVHVCNRFKVDTFTASMFWVLVVHVSTLKRLHSYAKGLIVMHTSYRKKANFISLCFHMLVSSILPITLLVARWWRERLLHRSGHHQATLGAMGNSEVYFEPPVSITVLWLKQVCIFWCW